jgi:sugar phosphate permease
MTSSAPVAADGMTPETARLFRSWQMRTLVATMLGYAAFYFVRKNLSVAMPEIGRDLGITKVHLGWFLTMHGLLYGVSRFVNGMWADRANARYFMVAGLMLSVGANVFFGFGSEVLWLGVAWMINGWVQGMGFPPCCRLMAHWFPPHQLATKMSIWNTSHSIGAWATLGFCGFVAERFGWRWCFFGPAVLCTIIGFVLFVMLRDTPSSVGLPEIKVEGTADTHGEDKNSADYKAFVRRHVFGNPALWWISLANFFVYILRFAVLDWGPTLLKEWKGFTLQHASWVVIGFEVAGIAGMLLAGWVTDRFFGGRGPRTCVFCMIGAGASLFAFWKLGQSAAAEIVFLGLAGFFIYGPQALIGIAAANLATKRAAATAAGFTGLFGYASTLVSGVGLGWMVQKHGWDAAFGGLLAMGACGLVCFLLAWPAKAHGYADVAPVK